MYCSQKSWITAETGLEYHDLGTVSLVVVLSSTASSKCRYSFILSRGHRAHRKLEGEAGQCEVWRTTVQPMEVLGEMPDDR